MVEVRINAEQVAAKLAQVASKARAAGVRVLNDVGAFHVREMTQKFKPYSGRTAGFDDSIHTRSGQTRRSFGFTVNAQGDDPQLRIFAAGLKHLRIQEYGGDIYPVNKKYLTVPLESALTPSGVLRGGARLVKRADGYYTADGRKTVIYPGRSGFGIIAEVRGSGKNRTLRPLYALRPFVRLRPRLGFARTFNEKTRQYAERQVGKALQEVLR